MASVFYSPVNLPIHLQYDLKGSTKGRQATAKEKAAGAILKDLDFLRARHKIAVGPNKAKLFKEQLRRDSEFLRKLKIMDYSLLVGICYRDQYEAALQDEKEALLKHQHSAHSGEQMLPTETVPSPSAKSEGGKPQHSRRKSRSRTSPLSAPQPVDTGYEGDSDHEPKKKDPSSPVDLDPLPPTDSASAFNMSPMGSAGTLRPPRMTMDDNSSSDINGNPNPNPNTPLESLAPLSMPTIPPGMLKRSSVEHSISSSTRVRVKKPKHYQVKTWQSQLDLNVPVPNEIRTEMHQELREKYNSKQISDPADHRKTHSQSLDAVTATAARSEDEVSPKQSLPQTPQQFDRSVERMRRRSSTPKGTRSMNGKAHSQPNGNPTVSSTIGINAPLSKTVSAPPNNLEEKEEIHINPFTREYGGMCFEDENGNKGNEIYFVGIIDVLQKYNRRKKLETFFVGLKHDKDTISSVKPELYAKRMRDFMNDKIE